MILQTADADGRPLKVPGIVPKLADTPGRLRTPAPRLGQHNDEVLGQPGWPAKRAGAPESVTRAEAHARAASDGAPSVHAAPSRDGPSAAT